MIKLTPQNLSVEELTKIWSVFFQTSYRISTAYQVTVILLESKLTPKPSLPVSKRQLRVFPIKQPTINAISPQMLEYDPAAQVTITGKNLMGDKVVVQFDDQQQTITDKSKLSETQITAPVPAGLSAGVKQVRVLELFLFDSADQGHPGYVSNVASFVLYPKITSLTKQVQQGGTLTVQFQPGAAKGQTINVLVGDYVLLATLPVDPASYPLSAVSVTVPVSVAAGSYPVRLRVDGADSQPPTGRKPNNPSNPMMQAKP